jgi:hypothetical protein
MKTDGLLNRNKLKGGLGDAMHALPCSAENKLRMILTPPRVVFEAFANRIALAIMLINRATSPQHASSRT